MAGGPDGRAREGEESPGFMETGCRITPGRGNPMDSATENKPPMAREGSGKGETVR